MNDERTPHGDPIYRHRDDAVEPRPADLSSPSLGAITEHIERYVGAVAFVWHEVVSEQVHIDIHVVAPTEERPFYTLITSGMSDRPMTTPAGANGLRYLELVIALPPDWPVTGADSADARHGWPIRWLRMLAHFPHHHASWLWLGHTMPNGNPAKPMAPGCPFTGVVLGLAATLPEEFSLLDVSPGKRIHFLTVLPVFPEEMALKLERGAEVLLDRFVEYEISEVVDVERINVGLLEDL